MTLMKMRSTEDGRVGAACDPKPAAEKDTQIEPMMAFSTSHIPQEVAARLEAGWLQQMRRLVSAPGLPEPHLIKAANGSVKAANVTVPSFRREEGWILHVYKDPDFWPDVEELQALFLKAEKAGCCWILLDCDGPVHEDLPTWEW